MSSLNFKSSLSDFQLFIKTSLPFLDLLPLGRKFRVLAVIGHHLSICRHAYRILGQTIGNEFVLLVYVPFCFANPSCNYSKEYGKDTEFLPLSLHNSIVSHNKQILSIHKCLIMDFW